MVGMEKQSLHRGGFRAFKPCDSCKSSAAAIFCRADSAFLCMLCDSKIHSANKLASRHERVWMCEVCEQAPASVTCKADAAVLCLTCDADIHSANPLANRHDRVPVEPFFDSAESVAKSSALTFTNLLVSNGPDGFGHEEPSEWLLSSNPKVLDVISSNPKVLDVPDVKSGDMFFNELEYPFLDFDYSNSFDQNESNKFGGCSNNNNNADSVVPVQASVPVISHTENCFNIDFCRSKLSSISYPTQSFSRQSVSIIDKTPYILLVHP